MITIKTHLERMFDHVHWANLRILAALQASDGKPDKAVRLFAHILGAENVWLTRMNGEDGGSFPIWPEADLAECGRMAEANRAGYARLFERLNESDLSEATTYRNTKGDVFSDGAGRYFNACVHARQLSSRSSERAAARRRLRAGQYGLHYVRPVMRR